MRRALASAAVVALLLAPIVGLVGWFVLSGDGDGGVDLEQLPVSLDGGGVFATFEETGDLEALPADAVAFRLSAPDHDAIEQLAAALGLDGDVEEAGGVLAVHTASGSLTAVSDAIGSWSFGPAGAASGSGSSGSAVGGVVTTGTVVASAPDGTCPVPDPGLAGGAEEPSAEAARAAGEIAARLVEASGFGLDEVEVMGSGDGGAQAVATARVGGRAVHGLSWTVVVDADGELIQALGHAPAVEEVGTFPLVGIGEAVERLRSGRTGAIGGGGVQLGAPQADGTALTIVAGPLPPEAVTTVPPAAGASEPCPPDLCEPVPVDRPVPIDPPVVNLVSAEAGLALVYGADGAAYLVPAALFAAEDGSEYATIVVVEDRLVTVAGVPLPVPIPLGDDIAPTVTIEEELQTGLPGAGDVPVTRAQTTTTVGE